MCNVVGSGTNGTEVAVACLNKNMESHVLQRQSNNKRDGEQLRCRATRPLSTAQYVQSVLQATRLVLHRSI